jgi:heterodisulfide reductase subunit B
MIQYDGNQHSIEKKFRETYEIPVFYHTELLCLAMGVPPEEIGVLHQVKISKALERVDLRHN